MPTFHIYWADKRPPKNQDAVADAVSRAMAALDEAMITGPGDVTFWFHRFRLADIYLNGERLGADESQPSEAEAVSSHVGTAGRDR